MITNTMLLIIFKHLNTGVIIDQIMLMRSDEESLKRSDGQRAQVRYLFFYFDLSDYVKRLRTYKQVQ